MKSEPPASLSCLTVSIWGLLTAAGALACWATIFGFLGRFWWFFDLFSHFRVQYLVCLTALGVLLLIGRRRRRAVVFLGFACASLVVVLPLYFGGRKASADGAPTIRAMLLNVNARLGDPGRVTTAILDASPDILVLEEISSRWLTDLAWLADSYPHSFCEPRDDCFGIGVFSKLPLAESKVLYLGEAKVPSIIATVSAGPTDLRLIATHPVPPGGRDYSRWRNAQLNLLPGYARATAPVLLLGDLNTTPWSYHFRRLLARSGLQDSARGYGVRPTWPSYNRLLRIPIDHCLHSADIAIVDRRVGPEASSDHFPLVVDFVIRRKTTAAGPVPGPAALE